MSKKDNITKRRVMEVANLYIRKLGYSRRDALKAAWTDATAARRIVTATSKACGTEKLYRLYNRVQHIFKDVLADSAQEACQHYGWHIGNVWVREFTPVTHDPTSESGHRGGGWKNVTQKEGG